MSDLIFTYGDIVTCKVVDNYIVSADADKWDVKLEFKVIGYSFLDQFYILHIPSYYNIKHSWTIDESDTLELCIKNSYIGQAAAAVKINKILISSSRNKSGKDGMSCSKCGVFYDYAESNQSDGTLICFSCRTNPYKMFKANK